MTGSHMGTTVSRALLVLVALLGLAAVAVEGSAAPAASASGSGNASSGSGHGSYGGGTGSSHGYYVIYFLFLSLACGAFFKFVFTQYIKVPIPYTVWMLVLGLSFGGVYNSVFYVEKSVLYGSAWDSKFLGSLEQVASIDAHLLLFTFLPPLIFESAFSIDFNIFARMYRQMLVLAGPAFLISTCCTAACAMSVFGDGTDPYDSTTNYWTWEVALLYGALMSATDPVAVVALLKELGADAKLGTLIEGESLLNDGTAVVVFQLFQPLVLGTKFAEMYSVGDCIAFFFRVALGGPAIGLAFGLVALYMLQLVFNDAEIEVSITLSFCYLAFFVAEGICSVSGVLAVVFFGLVMTSFGRTRVSPEVEHFLHEFWGMLGFIANTIIFVLTGVIISMKATFTTENSAGELSLNTNLLWQCTQMYLLCLLIRLFAIFLFFPIMPHLSKFGFSWKTGLVAWWGGLRGAVGLGLALIVYHDFQTDPKRLINVGDPILVSCSIMVLGTLCINGTTCGTLLKYLGMLQVPASKRLCFITCKEHLREIYYNNESALHKDPYMCGADFSKVKDLMPDFLEEDLSIEAKIISVEIAANGDNAIMEETKQRFIASERSMYHNLHKKGLLDSDIANQLFNYCSAISLEQPVAGVHVGATPSGMDTSLIVDWNKLDSGKRGPYERFVNHFELTRLAEGKACSRYDKAYAFIHAQESAEKMIRRMHKAEGNEIGTGASKGRKDSMGADVPVVARRQSMVQSTDAATVITQASHMNVRAAKQMLDDMEEKSPAITSAAKTKMAARTLLNTLRRNIHNMEHEGMLDKSEASKLVDDTERHMQRLAWISTSTEVDAAAVLTDLPWLAELDDEEREVVRAEHAIEETAEPEEVIIEAGSQSDFLAIIISGIVDVTIGVGDSKVSLTTLRRGAVIGELGVLTGEVRGASIVAKTGVKYYKWPKDKLEFFMGQHRSVKEGLWKTACERQAEGCLAKQRGFADSSIQELRATISEGVLHPISPESQDVMIDHEKTGAVLCFGGGKVTDAEKQTYSIPKPGGPKVEYIKAGSSVKLNSNAVLYIIVDPDKAAALALEQNNQQMKQGLEDGSSPRANADIAALGGKAPGVKTRWARGFRSKTGMAKHADGIGAGKKR